MGRVTLVGMDARFVTRAIPIAMIAVINRGKLVPDNIMANKVIGVRTQP
jgi:hypothetical protein